MAVALSKADPDFVRIQQVADSLVPELRQEFDRAFQALSRQMPAKELNALLEAGQFDAVLQMAADLKLPRATIETLREVTTSAALATAEPVAGAFGIRFDLVNPRAVQFASENAGQLITGITQETQRAIVRIIETGIREGIGPRPLALEIRSAVGLTERHALAVARVHRGLLDKGASLAFADRQAQRRADKLTRWRAEMIARTETIKASNMGQELAWQQGIDDGILLRGTKKVWIVTPDDRLCPLCAPMDGKIVAVGEDFTATERMPNLDPSRFRRTGDNRIPGRREPLKANITRRSPPLHPSCRCAIGIEVTT